MLCDPGLRLPLLRQTTWHCRAEATGRPQPIRPAGPGPQNPAPTGGAAGTQRQEVPGWGRGASLGPWPSGCQREPGSRPQPGCPLEGGPQGPEGFLPEVPLSPGARPPAAGTGPPGQGRGGGPRAAAAFQILGRLEPAQPQGPGWLRSPHKQPRSVSLGAGSRVCGKPGSSVQWGRTSRVQRSWPQAQGTTSTASRDAAPRPTPGPGLQGQGRAERAPAVSCPRRRKGCPRPCRSWSWPPRSC